MIFNHGRVIRILAHSFTFKNQEGRGVGGDEKGEEDDAGLEEDVVGEEIKGEAMGRLKSE